MPNHAAGLQGVIRRFDDFLSRQYRIFLISNEAGCILRLQLTRAAHAVQLPELLVQKGESLVGIAESGADMAWAVTIQRQFVGSLRLAALYVQNDPQLYQARAMLGDTSLFGAQVGGSGIHPMARLGFTILPHHSPLGRFGDFWENFYALAIIWAYSLASAKGRSLLNMQRVEMWMGVGDFLTRYG